MMALSILDVVVVLNVTGKQDIVFSPIEQPVADNRAAQRF